MIGLVAAGSANAGSLVTGAAIKDGTVTSADLRNGTVQLRDLAPSVRRTLTPGPAPAKPGVCTVQTFSGQGSAAIGDLSRSCESVIEWTSALGGTSDFFSIRDKSLGGISISSSAASGQSVEPAGLYPDVEVGTQDASIWTVTVRPA